MTPLEKWIRINQPLIENFLADPDEKKFSRLCLKKIKQTLPEKQPILISPRREVGSGIVADQLNFL